MFKFGIICKVVYMDAAQFQLAIESNPIKSQNRLPTKGKGIVKK